MKEHYNDDTDNPTDNGGHHKITIRPGTTSAGTAPLKFTSGSLLTTAEPGAVEYDGGYFYMTINGPARSKVATYPVSGTTGEIFYRNSSGTFAPLTPGSNGQVLTLASGIPAWSAVPGGGVAAEATKLETPRSIQTNLASTSAVNFDGTANVTPGVTGTLPLTSGGTGATTQQAALNALAPPASNAAKYLRSNGTNTLFSSIQAGDVPTLNQNTTGNAATATLAAGATKLATARTIQVALGSGTAVNFDGTANVTPGVTGTLPIASGGTAGTTQQAALNNLTAPATKTGQYLRSDGTNAAFAAIDAADIPNLNQDTTGNAATSTITTKLETPRSFQTNLASTSAVNFDGTANVTPGVTGTLPIANGGTAGTTQQDALNNLTIPASKSGQYLRSNGTNTAYSAIQAGDVPTLNQNTTGNAATATKLATARTIQANLSSLSSVSFDGTANITPGITGTLPVANGGTGATALDSGKFLVGNNTSPVTTTKSVPTGDVVGTSDTQTLSGKTISGSNNSITNLDANSISNLDQTVASFIEDPGSDVASAVGNLGVVTGTYGDETSTYPFRIWVGTKDEYENESGKNWDVIYMIIEEE